MAETITVTKHKAVVTSHGTYPDAGPYIARLPSGAVFTTKLKFVGGRNATPMRFTSRSEASRCILHSLGDGIPLDMAIVSKI